MKPSTRSQGQRAWPVRVVPLARTRRPLRVIGIAAATVLGLAGRSPSWADDAGQTASAGPVTSHQATPLVHLPTTAPTTSPGRLRAGILNELLSERDVVPTEAEWAEVAEFCRTNLPNRWAYFEQIQNARGGASPLVQLLKVRITARYRAIQSLATGGNWDNSDYYEQIVNQATLEDTAWAAAIAWQRDKSEAKLKILREATQKLVDAVLDNKDRQLNRLQDYINAEQALLSHQRSAEASLVEQQIQMLTDPNAFDDRFRNWSGPRNRFGGFGGFGPGGLGGRRDDDRPPGNANRETPATTAPAN
jgi:hypothetical protein